MANTSLDLKELTEKDFFKRSFRTFHDLPALELRITLFLQTISLLPLTFITRHYLFSILNSIATLYMWVTCLIIRKEYQSDRDGKQRGQDSTSEDKSP